MIRLFITIFFCSLILPVFSLENDFLVDDLDREKIVKPDTNLEYNYESVFCIPIHLKIKEKISTKDSDLYEGKVIEFRVEKTSFYKNRPLVKEGETVKAKVKSIVVSGLNGIPYSVLIDDFEINNIDSSKLRGGYQKDGFNRTYLVLPLKWILTPLPPSGSLTNFIKGGHAKITKRDDITLYYYPNWGK